MSIGDQISPPLAARSFFRACFDRVERAKSHRDQIALDCSEFETPDPDELIQVRAQHGRGSVTSTPRNLPVGVSLDLGEFLYQLRAALDGGVYASAILDSGRDIPEKVSQLEFPICTSPAEFKKASAGTRDKLHGLGRIRRGVIESAQPYPGRSDFRLAALKTLHDWARKDRHRFPRVVAAMFVDPQVLLNYPEGVVVEWSVPQNRLGRMLFERGRVDLKITGGSPDRAANWYGSGQTMILADGCNYEERQPLVRVLDDMVLMVNLVLESLETGTPVAAA